MYMAAKSFYNLIDSSRTLTFRSFQWWDIPFGNKTSPGSLCLKRELIQKEKYVLKQMCARKYQTLPFVMLKNRHCGSPINLMFNLHTVAIYKTNRKSLWIGFSQQ